MHDNKNNQPALPYWISQKTVQAAQIVAIRKSDYDLKTIMTLDAGGAGKITQPVSDAYMDQHRPHIGGYYVRGENGRESFAPAGQFEGAFTLQRGSRIATLTISEAELQELAFMPGAVTENLPCDDFQVIRGDNFAQKGMDQQEMLPDGVTMTSSPGVDIDRAHSVWGKGQGQPAFPTVASKVPNEN